MRLIQNNRTAACSFCGKIRPTLLVREPQAFFSADGMLILGGCICPECLAVATEVIKEEE